MTAQWTLQQLETNHHGYDWPTYAIRSKENCCIAVVGEVDRYHAEQYESIARLMTAAPDLLKALIACQTIINREVPDGSIAHDMRAAIAKAEGKTP